MNAPHTKRPATGDPFANTVELTEFGDFTCFRSRANRKLINSILKAFNSQVTYTYRHFPAPESESSWLAALALEAARRQHKFWPMHNALSAQSLFDNATIFRIATDSGLDHHQFLNDLQDKQLHNRLEADREEGTRLGVRTTPTLFVDGHQFHGKLTLARLAPVLRFHLSRRNNPLLNRTDPANGIVYWREILE